MLPAIFHPRRSWLWLFASMAVLSSCATPTELAPAPTARSATAVPHLPATVTPSVSSPIPATYSVSQQRAYSLTVQTKNAHGAALNLTLDYLLYLPDGYEQDPQRQWPLILFLHGAGQRGDQIDQVARLGLPNLLNTRLKLPALVVSPHLPSGAYWTDYVTALEKLLDQIMAQYAIDPKRVYVTGFSLGGYGMWALGLAAPDRFAALVPVAGGWDAGATNLCTLKSVPVWALHGANDELVSPAASAEVVKALQACGGNVRFTLLPRTTHEAAATVAYLQPGLFDWLLAQRLP
jgi:predicted peptidase